MRVWCVANQKGGVGKTTTTVSLGGLLAKAGHRSLLVDMDPHGSMSAYFGHDPDHVEPSVYGLFQQAAGGVAEGEPIHPTAVPGLDLIPASTALVSLDRQFGAREGMGLVLARALARWSGRYDVVLLDCPPMLGILMVNAMAACERVIVPVQTEFLALRGLERLLHTLAMVARARPAPLPYTLVPTLFDRRTRASLDSLQWLQENHEDHLWPGTIPVDTSCREASRAGLPLANFRPSCRAALAYQDLLEHLLATPVETLRRVG